MENEMSSTPPTLANVGLHRVTETLNRRFKGPKKLVACSTDDELFVKRPHFTKKNLAGDQEMEEEGGENWVTNNLEGPNSTLIAQKLMNFLMMASSHRWIWHEFGDSFVNAPILRGAYDLGSFLREYYPELKTSILPRRGWQLLRRSLGKARRYSPSFIELELKEYGPSVPQAQQSKERYDYSTKLLESIVLVKRLLAKKKKALLEIASKNEEFENGNDFKSCKSSKGSKNSGGSKTTLQLCFATLYRVNADIMAPMTVLHEHLAQFRKEQEEMEAMERSALEIYAKCCHRAEMDLQLAERHKSLVLTSPATRDLVQALQTILYITGELGGPNSAELLVIQDNLISHLQESLPPALSAQLKKTMKELEPYRQRMNELFKIVPKESPIEEMQWDIQ